MVQMVNEEGSGIILTGLDRPKGSETATDVLVEFRRGSIHDSFVSKSVESLLYAMQGAFETLSLFHTQVLCPLVDLL